MKPKIKKIIFCLLFVNLLIPFIPVYTQVRNDNIEQLIENRRKRENELKAQVEDLLAKIIGPNDSVVTVSIRITAEERAVKKIQKLVPSTENDILKDWILPELRRPRDDKPPINEEETTIIKPSREIKNVNILIDKKNTDEIIKTIKNTVESHLGIDENNGDKLYIGKIDLKPSSPMQGFFKDKWNTILAIIGFVVVSVILFLFGPVRMFLNSLLRTFQESKGRQIGIDMGGGLPGGGAAGVMTGGPAGALGPGGEKLTEGQLAEGTTGEEGTEEISTEEGGIVVEQGGAVKVLKPFSFIKKSNIPNLVYLVQEEPPEIIALIMSYLNPDQAADLMANLPTELQGKVALSMATVKQASQDSVSRAEESIKKKINFLVGGLERFTSIIERVDAETKEEVLQALAKESPALAERLRKELATFDSILELEDAALQIVLREIKTDTLAKALKDAQEEILNKVKKNISTGAATLLLEEMELQGYLTPAQINTERKKIMDIIYTLEKEGKITIKRTRKKQEKIEKLEQLDAKLEKYKDANKRDEALKRYGVSTDQKNGEKPVSLKDYEDKVGKKALSMTDLFKERIKGKGTEEQGKNEPEQENLIGPGAKKERAKTTASSPAKPDKNQAGIHYKNAMSLYQTRKYKEALMEFEKSILADNSYWQSYQGIGNCYTAIGTVDKAIAFYERALKLNPSNAGLKDWLEKYKAKQGVK